LSGLAERAIRLDGDDAAALVLQDVLDVHARSSVLAEARTWIPRIRS
jgi:hypothetical protein